MVFFINTLNNAVISLLLFQQWGKFSCLPIRILLAFFFGIFQNMYHLCLSIDMEF